MTKQLPEKDSVLINAFSWLADESLDKCFIKLGWKPIFETIEVNQQFFWAKLLVRLDVPDDFVGLRAVLPSIEWLLEDLAASSYVDQSSLSVAEKTFEGIKTFFEKNQQRHLRLLVAERYIC
jgi:hypothetical protein